jgi:hypothetical protein
MLYVAGNPGDFDDGEMGLVEAGNLLIAVLPLLQKSGDFRAGGGDE